MKIKLSTTTRTHTKNITKCQNESRTHNARVHVHNIIQHNRVGYGARHYTHFKRMSAHTVDLYNTCERVSAYSGVCVCKWALRKVCAHHFSAGQWVVVDLDAREHTHARARAGMRIKHQFITCWEYSTARYYNSFVGKRLTALPLLRPSATTRPQKKSDAIHKRA